jgi:hypothetical protein
MHSTCWAAVAQQCALQLLCRDQQLAGSDVQSCGLCEQCVSQSVLADFVCMCGRGVVAALVAVPFWPSIASTHVHICMVASKPQKGSSLEESVKWTREVWCHHLAACGRPGPFLLAQRAAGG